MKTTPAPRARRQITTVSFCVIALFMFMAPSAHAGLLDDVVSTVDNVVENTVPGVVEAVAPAAPAEGGAGLGGAVAGVVGAISDAGGSAITETVGTVTNTVEQVGNEVEGQGGPVKEVVQEVGQTAAAATETIRGTAERIGGSNPDAKKNDSRSPRGTRADQNDKAPSSVLAASFAEVMRIDAQTPVVAIAPSDFVQPAGESFVSQVSRIATEAAQQMAFPMFLMLLVGGFLFVQNRIDRSDPKLALAPVESDHDLLSFT